MTAVRTYEPAPVAATTPRGGSITDLLQLAVERGTPVAELKELVALHREMQQQQAERDFAAAMAAFQQQCPSIHKSRTAAFATKSGGKVSYSYAPIEQIAKTANPILARLGLSYTWDTTVSGNHITVTCTVRHDNGASRSSAIQLPSGSSNPLLSDQQKMGAAWTFARRLSLVSALGLTTTDDDLDGRDVVVGNVETITDDQATALSDLIAETGTDLPRFLKFFKVGRVDDLPATRYTEAQRMLEKKRGAS